MRIVIGLVALALALPAAAEAKPCHPTYCSHAMRVGTTPVHWTGGQKMRELSRLDTSFRGHLLDYHNEGCVSYASGYGILVKFNGCGHGAQPLRVTAVSLRKRPATIRIVYG